MSLAGKKARKESKTLLYYFISIANMAADKKPALGIVKKETILLLIIAIIALVVIAGVFFVLGIQIPSSSNQPNASSSGPQANSANASISYDPAENLGSRIAENSNPNPLSGVPLNPFSK